MAFFDVDNYVDVQDRITRFWEEYPNGAINTEVVFSPDYDHVIVKASVYKSMENKGFLPDATGIAGEERGPKGPNQTNWHENCETSAIGRALANMGYATSLKDRPSRQEMEKVNRLSSPEQPSQPYRPAPPQNTPTNFVGGDAVGPTEKQGRMIYAIRNELGMSEEELHDLAGVASLKELSRSGVSALIDKLKALQAGEEYSPTQADLARPVAGGSGDDEIVDWGQFYGYARAVGINNRQDYEKFLGGMMPQSPAEALAAVKQKMGA